MVTVEQVMSRLSQLGYPVTEAERPVVEFEYDLILDYVVNYCNMFDRSEIPTILDKRIIDRICSEYLFKQQKAGLLPNFNYDAFVKTIKEGDTQIQYGNSSDGETPESRFIDLCNKMERGFDKWICRYRRLVW